jgi:hypothetical protein|tara:strand:+ start:56973 stop:57353 length:381 start_codon:yes stop_codon:yes gene_type:complete
MDKIYVPRSVGLFCRSSWIGITNGASFGIISMGEEIRAFSCGNENGGRNFVLSELDGSEDFGAGRVYASDLRRDFSPGNIVVISKTREGDFRRNHWGNHGGKPIHRYSLISPSDVGKYKFEVVREE